MLLLELQTDQLTNFQMSRVSLVRSRAGIGSAGARFLAVAVSVSVADAQIWAGAVLKQVNGFRMLLMELQTAQFTTSNELWFPLVQSRTGIGMLQQDS